MLTPPDISDDRIIACLHDSFGLHISEVTFLPIGADGNSAVYRVTADDGTPYFLKLRRGNFDEVAVAVPVLLHAQGIRHVMSPIATTTGRLWVPADGFSWILYPFFEGKNGYQVALLGAQWAALGESMKAVHAARLPAELQARMPRAAYSPRWQEVVRAFHREVEERTYDDPIAAGLAAFWSTKRDEIDCIVERAADLAHALPQRALEPVVCHADLHAGNVLLGADDALAIVDWDEIILAPKERDLMSVGGGLFGDWNPALEAEWFYAGYGPTAIDPVALAYYRYERIVADIAAYAEQIFGMQGSAEDREQGLRQLMGQFLPNEVVDLAHRSYPRPA
ncbi:MAG TPA: aminoglycoside phosphotransferase family protein [Herpetosiphonaceae bacterium]|nr:aminoglycoside phosphotransferase family protein [Herpetosiphonaceae bacterium]